jgi:predicted nucleic acid-binding protein
VIVFLDTMVLVWWVRKEASTGQSSMVTRARWLMDSLDAGGEEVMVSAVSVGEFLRGSQPQARSAQNIIIEETFIVRPFDNLAANIAADKFANAVDADGYEDRKTVLKADLMILATAVASRADVIYSHDTNLRKLAEKCGVRAKDLPEVAPSLFQPGDDHE